MSTVWKAVVALALVLPMGAFVAGSLASSAADEPSDRDPVILREAPQQTSDKPAPIKRKPQEREETEPEAPVVIAPEPASTDDWDDDDRDDDGDDRGDDDRDDEWDDDDDEGDDDGDG